MLGTLAHPRVQVLQIGGQVIAYALELAEVEQRGAAGSRRVERCRCSDVWEALGDNRRTLSLEARDLCPQGYPRSPLVGADGLVWRGEQLAGEAADPRLGVVSVDDLLLVVSHTRLLSGSSRFYQRTCAGRGSSPTSHRCSSMALQLHSASSAYSVGTPDTCTANSFSRLVRACGS